MLPDVLALAGGLALLMAAANALVRGASALALRLGLTPLVVGLTVVAFGTSAPELVVSVQAALAGAGGIAVGNVVGSNVANVALILAVAVLVRTMATDRALFRRDLPTLVVATAGATAFLLDGVVGRVEGAVLLVSLVAYLTWSVRTSRREQAAVELPVEAPTGPAWRDAVWTAAGLVGLVVGADLFVGGAVALAEAAGVSNAVIGLTVVAVGTSLPELATSVVAAVRGEGEIAAGNVIGSNLFNLLGILGVGALVRPLAAPGLEPVDLAVMGVFTLALVPMMRTGWRLVRVEAAVLLLGYAAYVGYLVSQHV
jgi:cation:H+ antiporter